MTPETAPEAAPEALPDAAPKSPPEAPPPAAGMTLVPLALLILLGAMWGASFSLAKIATTGGVHPFGLLLWQAAGGALIVTVFCALRGRLRALRLRHSGYYLGCGMFGIVGPSTAIYWAASHVPAGVMALMVSAVPMVTYGLALGFRIERFRWPRICGIGLGFVAVLLIVVPRASLPDPDMVGWVLIGALGPLCYACSNIFVARLRPAGSDSTALAVGMLASAALISLPLALVSGGTYMIGPPWDATDIAVLGLPTITGIAHIFLFELIRIAGPVFFSQVGYVVTVAGVFWGVVLFGERHSPWIWASLALMFAGIALVNLRRRPQKKSG